MRSLCSGPLVKYIYLTLISADLARNFRRKCDEIFSENLFVNGLNAGCFLL
ncbi:hypothetical protein LINPERHAP1_LOCUS17431 [Linum perenne]